MTKQWQDTILSIAEKQKQNGSRQMKFTTLVDKLCSQT